MDTQEVRDANGNLLENGDSVILTQDLKVKGSSDLKRGTVIKNIRLDEDEDEAVECRIGKSVIVIKTCYLKKKPTSKK